jgi:hypothetical protein
MEMEVGFSGAQLGGARSGRFFQHAFVGLRGALEVAAVIEALAARNWCRDINACGVENNP